MCWVDMNLLDDPFPFMVGRAIYHLTSLHLKSVNETDHRFWNQNENTRKRLNFAVDGFAPRYGYPAIPNIISSGRIDDFRGTS